MIYTDLNAIRTRSNKIGTVLNAATDYGRRPLPDEYSDLQRDEWVTLADIFQHPTEHPELFKGGIEVVTVRRRLAT